MAVFICWSGDRSKTIAHALKQLLSAVLPKDLKLFVSEEIDKGAEWFQVVRAGLHSSRAGIIVLTHENLRSPWMHFEAGALAQSLGAVPAIDADANAAIAATTSSSIVTTPAADPKPRAVFPLLHGVNPAGISGPLAAYQATRTTRADMGRLISALAKVLGIAPSPDGREFVIPPAVWSTFERTLKTATAPLATVIPGFESWFRRKTFEEAFHQCTSQDWLARYEAAKATHARLAEQHELVSAACAAHEQGLYKMLLSDLDVYAMAIEALLITRKDFKLGTDGVLEMDSGTRICCEDHRLAIKSLSTRLLHPQDPPLTTAAVRFMAAGTPEERRAIVHRLEGRIRWHREIAYDAAADRGQAQAERAVLTELMTETSEAGDGRSHAWPQSGEPVLQCATPQRLMTFRASSWDLDRIFYYRLVYYFDTSALRWTDVAIAGFEDIISKAAPTEHDFFCAARDVEVECERYRARMKGGSQMPLIYALDALQGLHPRLHETPSIERAVTSAITLVKTEIGPLLESTDGAEVRRLLDKVW